MTILSDRTIRGLSTVGQFEMMPQMTANMITPFTPHLVKKEERYINTDKFCGNKEVEVISYGLSSFGYDARLAESLEIFTPINVMPGVDPKRPPANCRVPADVHVDEWGASFAWLPPHSFMLGHTVETFKIPRDVLVVCLGKSTYARAGIIVNVTPLEPEWEGQVVIEISNTTQLPQKIYVNEGIAQFLFLKGDVECETSYKDRGGKYQGQRGIVVGKV